MKQRVEFKPKPDRPDADWIARKIIIHAFLYYVMDAPIVSDEKYDKWSRYVARHWDELAPDRKWALRDPETTRATGHHIRFSSFAVAAALNYHKYKTGLIYRSYPEDVWRRRKKDGCRFVTCSAGKPKWVI